MPDSARLPSGNLVEVLWGQPAQNQGERSGGAAGRLLASVAAARRVGGHQGRAVLIGLAGQARALIGVQFIEHAR